ncbi:glycosyltransferase [uncultured Methanobrevibacter sp.]|uniref:glycosyltransferase family 2 protein n=1 Tax=uncultured Methanobrevibacter sp. TaxID=253161 RepID=UPI0025F3651D|nr:glycosyltransferase [uncultured Methanobrevibacter sp.]
MEKPKISVIMPSLNVGDYMEQCLSSVLNQSLKEIEVICVDAGSTDQTLDIIKKHQESDKRIKIITSDKKSYGHQVNLGLKEAKGIYISIVETDDYIDENMLNDLYEFSQNNTVDIIKANFYYLNDYGDEVELVKDTAKNFLIPNEVFILKEQPLFIEGHPSIWAGIYLREFLEKNNITFLEVPKGGWVDNPFFYETALKAQKIIYLDKQVYYYRITNPNSSTNDFNDNTLPMKRILDIYDVLEENKVKDENIILFFYKRLFRYIEIILESNDNDLYSLDYETCCYIQKVLKKVDSNLVRCELISNFKVLYYKFMSPLLLQHFEENK